MAVDLDEDLKTKVQSSLLRSLRLADCSFDRLGLTVQLSKKCFFVQLRWAPSHGKERTLLTKEKWILLCMSIFNLLHMMKIKEFSVITEEMLSH